MKTLKFYFMLLLLTIPIIAMTAPVTAQEDEHNTQFIKNDNGYYKVRIEASQWEFKAYDMVKAAEDDVDLSTTNDEVKKEYEVKHRIEMEHAKKGDKIEFHMVSRDVQHGFSINEFDLAVALNRPDPGNEFGAPTIAEVELTADELADDNEGSPGDGVTYSSFCHIFCGLGHPDMKLKFVLGGGAIEFGPIVFYAALAINVAIFGLTLRSIVTKIGTLPEEEPVAN